MTSRRRVAVGVLSATLALSAVPLVATPAGAVTGPEVVASGLNAPNKLTFGPDGDLYVAESGTGGEEDCLERENPETGETESLCLGETGSVTRIDLDGEDSGHAVYGLPSLGGSEGATGPVDVAFDSNGVLHVVSGLGGGEEEYEHFQDDRIGALVKVVEGTAEVVTNLVEFEIAEDPDQAYNDGLPAEAPPISEGIDSNPFGVTFDGDDALVADAGGNTVVRVTPEGTATLEALLPFGMTEAPPFLGLPPGTEIPYQPVPTAIEMDGAAPLVSTLTGFPFPVGEAKIWGLNAVPPSEVHDDLTNIIDFDLAPDGSTYVLEFADNGLLSENPEPALVQIRADGTRKYLAYGAEALPAPAGVEVGEDGMVYVSVLSLAGPGAGQVWRFDPTAAADPAIGAACDPADVPGTDFPDIKGSVHDEAIECMAFWGAISGFGDGTFGPNANITRAQVASMIARALETAGFPLPEDAPDAFDDDDGNVHEDNIDVLAELGIIQGASGGGYGPGELVTRDQLATLFARTWAVVTKAALEPGEDAFDDDEGNVHEDAINAVAAAGWVKGVDEATFAPRANATRGQFASMLARMLSSLVEDNGVTPPAP